MSIRVVDVVNYLKFLRTADKQIGGAEKQVAPCEDPREQIMESATAVQPKSFKSVSGARQRAKIHVSREKRVKGSNSEGRGGGIYGGGSGRKFVVAIVVMVEAVVMMIAASMRWTPQRVA
eukprot:6191218-Pleurochrysis_carterae.AAC.1